MPRLAPCGTTTSGGAGTAKIAKALRASAKTGERWRGAVSDLAEADHVPLPEPYVAGSAPCPAAPPAAPTSPDTLYPGRQLDPGSQLSSADGRYTLVMQTDGNLVEYVADQPVWASGTYDPGSVLQAQADGNVVIYGPGHVAVWATNTDQPGSVLVVQDDGNIVVYAPGHTAVWATGRNEAEV